MRGKNHPALAAANLAFTPMTHKVTKTPETPYMPLNIEDLETPEKLNNKSHSSSEHLGISSQQLFAKPSKSDIQDASLNELRNMLMNAVKVIDTLQKQNKKHSYRSVQTQTVNITQDYIEKPKETKKYKPIAENTEVVINEESTRIDPIRNKPTKKESVNYKKLINSSNKTSLTLDGSPIQPYKKYVENNSPNSNSPSPYDNKFNSSYSNYDEKDLQERMHHMSMLLHNLENQLDNIIS